MSDNNNVEIMSPERMMQTIHELQTHQIELEIQNEELRGAQFELETQLQQAQKMEAVGRLAGSVVHKINNMLGVILGYVEMALEVVDPVHGIYSDLTEIRKVTILSAELTKKLLAFSRKQDVSHKILVLNETIDGE